MTDEDDDDPYYRPPAVPWGRTRNDEFLEPRSTARMDRWRAEAAETQRRQEQAQRELKAGEAVKIAAWAKPNWDALIDAKIARAIEAEREFQDDVAVGIIVEERKRFREMVAELRSELLKSKG